MLVHARRRSAPTLGTHAEATHCSPSSATMAPARMGTHDGAARA